MWRSPGLQDKGLHQVILGAFNNLGALSKSGCHEQAVQQLIAASECDEVGLGTSATKKGTRIGCAKAEEVLSLFERIPYYRDHGFRHFEEVQLFVDGIGKDRISDIACNFIKSFLIDYTAQECQELGVELKRALVPNVYNPSTLAFEDVETEGPVHPESGLPVLLVPKRWLRHVPWINYDGYFRDFCSNGDSMLISVQSALEPAEEAGDDTQAVRFRPASALTPAAVVAIAEQVRVRVLRWFARSALIERDDVREMRALGAPPSPTAGSRSMPRCAWARTIAPAPFPNWERLLRYCARPPFVLERLELLDVDRVVYRLPKPQRDGTTALALTPLELIDHLAAQPVHRLAPAQAPPPSRRARVKRAAAGGCHCLRARGGGRHRLTERGQFAAPGAGLQYPLPGALSLGHAALVGSSRGCSSRCRWSVPTAARLSAASRTSPRPRPSSRSSPAHR